MNDLQGFQQFLTISLSPADIALRLAAAFVCGLLVSQFYSWITRRPAHAKTFTTSLIALSLITAIVIMVIGNNLARAFGLVGAMSIIRFRTAVKDVQDIVFIFFSLAVGMAAGVGMYALAFLSSGMVGSLLLILSRFGNYAQKKQEYMLLLSYEPSEGVEVPYLPLLQRYCKRHQLINTKSDGDGEILELAFYVNLKNEENSEALVQELRTIDGIERVNLYFDEEYF
ncbi:MAG: putative membrane protein YhiD involved in acid resistance [Candidatus Latescibacterota bacterium]